MQALRFHEFGSPAEVLRLEELVLPDPGAGEVRLRVLASPVNPADLNLVTGTYGTRPPLPAVAGIEGCGEVELSEDPFFQPGDKCLFLRGAGAWASHVQRRGADLYKLLPEVDSRQAAMLKVNPATAWRMLHDFVSLPRGSWILQNAANSGVGRCVIQLAPALGVHTVNLVRRAELIPQLMMLGADHVLLDDNAAIDALSGICRSLPPMLALNCVGGDSALRLMNGLAAGGTHVTYGAMARQPLKVPNGLMIFKDLRLHGFWLSRWIDHAPPEELWESYGFLADELLAGRLKQPVDSSFGLERFGAALDRLDDPARHGKVLFEPGS